MIFQMPLKTDERIGTLLCTEFTLVKHSFGEVTAEPLRCRSWQCPECAPMRKRELKRLADSGDPTIFLTLTVNPQEYASPDRRAVKLAHAWRKLRRAAMKKYSYAKLPFIAVFEKTQHGEPHLHILMRCKWLDQRWVSNFMRDQINAPIVDIRWIKNRGQLAAYLTKYIQKDPHKFEGTKRYWRSQDYRLREEVRDRSKEDPNGFIQIVKMDWWTFVTTCTDRGVAGLVTGRKASFRKYRLPP